MVKINVEKEVVEVEVAGRLQDILSETTMAVCSVIDKIAKTTGEDDLKTIFIAGLVLALTDKE